MAADPRHRALGLAVGLVAVIATAGLTSAAPARAGRLARAGRPAADAAAPRRATSATAPAVEARVVSTFVMSGRITRALRVRGEHPGQLITRHWQFSGQGCTGNVCRALALRRERADHRFSRIVLARVGVGRYAGRGRFYAALRCRGRRYPRGEEVPYRITVRVTRAASIEGLQFAAGLAATYTSTRRIDRTRCPLGPSHDAAVYTGTAAPLPSPPTAAFTAAVAPATDDARFTDTSTTGAGGAPVAGWYWVFGDPASGSADISGLQNPQHTFSVPGTYRVCLIIRDANDLSAGTCAPVTVGASGSQPAKRTVASTAES
jgi:hypothetical protein